jgi:septal ring-binding cell division protein DamX
MDTQLGYWRWKLFRWNDRPNPYRNQPDLAHTWLSQFHNNASAMADLQTLLGNSATGAYSTPVDQAQLLRLIADKMATGEIIAAVELCGPVALMNVTGAGQEEVEPDLSQLQSSSKPAPAPAPAPAAAAESTLSPDNDTAAQVAVLKAAAAQGVPFCEECEKAAAAAAA